ncbi:MAG: STAS domain-containing protein [Phycisphaeraceae bacterium]
MEIHEQQHGAVTVLKPNGPLIQTDADQFKQRFNAALGQSLGRLVVDTSAVAFVDSRGLEVLVEATTDLAQSGQALRVCGTNETLREVLDLTGLAPLFEHYADVNSAVRSFL